MTLTGGRGGGGEGVQRHNDVNFSKNSLDMPPKGKKRSPDTDDNEKQRLATLKRLKRGEVDLR